MSRLNPDQVRTILLSCDSGAAVARQLGLHKETVYQVRRGLHYTQLFPELPRSSAASCTQCCHWCDQGDHGHCGLGFPDALSVGARYAQICSAFSPGDSQ